jgi:mycofactocin biosynthetic radical S-adenosylmethionine protein MftC
VAHPNVATGDSFFHLSAFGAPLPGMNMCGAGRIVCLIDPVGDVYACPFLIAPEFRAGNVLEDGGFEGVWRGSELFARLRQAEPGGACASCPALSLCHGGCMAAKYFTGMSLDEPDPDCVRREPDANAELPGPPAQPLTTGDLGRGRVLAGVAASGANSDRSSIGSAWPQVRLSTLDETTRGLK